MHLLLPYFFNLIHLQSIHKIDRIKIKIVELCGSWEKMNCSKAFPSPPLLRHLNSFIQRTKFFCLVDKGLFCRDTSASKFNLHAPAVVVCKRPPASSG